jgi:hypothetical protein
MNKFTLFALLMLVSLGANAQVTCSRTGDQVYCHGALQQPKPAAPRVYYDPGGSYISGYEAGRRAGMARNVASATQLYLNGEVERFDRQRFLDYMRKYGGDVTWFRNDMIIQDQDNGIADEYTPGWRPESQAPARHTQTHAERLKLLDELRASDTINQAEYELKRKQILDSL